jgi:ribosomal protein S18 acetylase RimI-like enzyme
MPEVSAAARKDPLHGTPDADTLDNPIWASLTGPHARFAEVRGQAVRYPPDVSPFIAIDPDFDERVWDDVARLVGPGGLVPLAGLGAEPPAGWEVVGKGDGLQLVGIDLDVEEDPEIVRLTAQDVPEMLGLVDRAKPGPFLPRTIELGRYLGIRRGGALVAMAGERLHPPGWTEISAICTEEAYRGHGFATRLTRAVAAGIRSRGETPFLHAAATNTNAIRLYQQLGFVVRRQLDFQLLRLEADQASA